MTPPSTSTATTFLKGLSIEDFRHKSWNKLNFLHNSLIIFFTDSDQGME